MMLLTPSFFPFCTTSKEMIKTQCGMIDLVLSFGRTVGGFGGGGRNNVRVNKGKLSERRLCKSLEGNLA